jgi:iron(III) transport system ATP-binding protein
MQDKASSPALDISAIRRSFGAQAALAGLSLTVARGEIVTLVGHSGCGKSTLLRVIAGIERPDGGAVVLEGEMVSGPDRFVEPEERKIGFVFQDYALFPHLTAMQNILFGLRRRPKAEAAAMAAEVISIAGIGHLTDRYPHMLSGGEQQRVALARALAPRPRILLMDEPFSNLDQGLREQVRTETIALLRTLGTTAIIVTHDPQEALSAGDRVVLMRAGEIVQVGTGYDLHDRPNCAYAAEFFSLANKIPGISRNGRMETAIGSFAHGLDLRDEESGTVYVRFQDITVSVDEGDLPARIIRRSFQGEIEELTLDVEGLQAPIRTRTMRRLPDDAQSVRISIAPERVLAFA